MRWVFLLLLRGDLTILLIWLYTFKAELKTIRLDRYFFTTLFMLITWVLLSTCKWWNGIGMQPYAFHLISESNTSRSFRRLEEWRLLCKTIYIRSLIVIVMTARPRYDAKILPKPRSWRCACEKHVLVFSHCAHHRKPYFLSSGLLPRYIRLTEWV
jgi:hypothetical protein